MTRWIWAVTCAVSVVAWAQGAPPSSKQQIKLEGLKLNQKPKVILRSPEELGLTTAKKENKAYYLPKLPFHASPEYMATFQFVTDEKLFNSALDTVNGLVSLPRQMLVFFDECGTANAFFNPKTGHITVCSELVTLLDQTYSAMNLPRDVARERIRGAMFFIFLHELGHALIHELQLPSTGKEEDAVDQFATLMLLENGQAGAEAAFSGALFFLALGEAKKGQELPWWDEHSLEQQRFYNVACWLFGASPFEQLNLVTKGVLPQARAARCGEEFSRMHSAWKTIADPKLKRPLK